MGSKVKAGQRRPGNFVNWAAQEQLKGLKQKLTQIVTTLGSPTD